MRFLTVITTRIWPCWVRRMRARGVAADSLRPKCRAPGVVSRTAWTETISDVRDCWKIALGRPQSFLARSSPQFASISQSLHLSNGCSSPYVTPDLGPELPPSCERLSVPSQEELWGPCKRGPWGASLTRACQSSNWKGLWWPHMLRKERR